MKKIMTVAAVLLILLFIIPSCNKQLQTNTTSNNAVTSQPTQVVSAKIASGQNYTLNLGTSGTGFISKQAAHFEVSNISVNDKDGSVAYNYKPAADYTGDDVVSLSYTSYGTPGSCDNHDHTGSGYTVLITVKINVSN